MSVAAPITSLTEHIAALQRSGAVAIWPLDDSTIGAGGSFRELSGNNWLLQSLGGQTGTPGPFPDATAYSLSVEGNDLYNNNPSSSWPASFGQPALTVCHWDFYPAGVSASYTNTRIGWAPANDRLTWETGWNTAAASLNVQWGGASPSRPIEIPSSQARSLLEGNWTHLVVVMDTNVARMYANGDLIGSGSLTPPAGIDRPLNFRVYSNPVPGVPVMQALALFDRALTDQEVKDLLYAAPPVSRPIKIWDGSDWIGGDPKGWDGTEWRPAKVWTGSEWV